MKILIPYRTNKIGGTSTFVNKFTDIAKKYGHEVVSQSNQEYDAVLVIADCSLRMLFRAKLAGKRIIQRLDGVYYPASIVGNKYWLLNWKMKFIYKYLSDHIIYQSRFSKLVCEKYLGKKGKGSWTLIYNGIDLQKVKPEMAKGSDKSLIKLVVDGRFRSRDQLMPIIESFLRLKKGYCLDVYGSCEGEVADVVGRYKGIDGLRFFPGIDNNKLIKIIGSYDIFLFSHQSACPNSVIEAMAVGLPVVAFDRGSLGELVKDEYSGKLVKTKKHDIFYDAYPFSEKEYRLMGNAIKVVAKKLTKYKHNARKWAESKFDIEDMMTKYFKVIESKK